MEEKNKEVIRRFYQEFFNDHIVDSADRYVREDYVQHNPGVEQGRDGLKRGEIPGASGICSGYPDVDRGKRYGCGLSEKCSSGWNDKMPCC